MDMSTRLKRKMGMNSEQDSFGHSFIISIIFFLRDTKEYALKHIDGVGLSMSACREIAVYKMNMMKSEFIDLIIVAQRIETSQRN